MDTNQVSLTRTMLNISTPNNQGVNFSQGEVLKGVVQEVRSDGIVMITIKGQTIEALTEVPVKPGQQLYLKVDDFRDGKTFLKVITPQAMEAIENTNLSANLVEMGIPAKEENVAMARKLLAYNMPATANNLSEMAKGIKLLGAATPRNLEIVAFVMSRNLPVDASTLKAFEQYTLPGSNIARLLESVVQSLRELGQTQTLALRDNQELILPDAAKNAGTAGKAPLTAGTSPNVSTPAGLTNPSGGNVGNMINTATPTGEAVTISTAQANIPAPTAPGAAAVIGGETLPLPGSQVSAAQVSATQSNIPLPTTDLEPAITMPITSETDSEGMMTTGSRSASGSAPADNTGSKPGAPPISTPNPQTSNLSTNTFQSAITSEPAPPETSQAPPALASNNPVPDQISAKASTTQNPGPAMVVEEGNQRPALSATTVGSIDLPEEMPVNTRVSPNIAESSTGKTLAAPASQTAPAPLISDDMPELASPAGLTTNPAASKEETPVQAPLTAGTNAKDGNAPGSILEKPPPASTGTTSAATGSDLPKTADNTGVQTSGTASTSNIPAGTSKLSDQLNLLKTLIEWMQVDGRDPAADISGKLERAVASDKDVIRGLTLLQDAIKSENTQTRSPVVHDLLQRIDNLEKELSGQKMFNYLSRTNIDNQFNFYYFSIPVKVGEEMHQCQLRINKDGRRDLRNVDNLSFVVSLDTGKMGLVLFHVNWQRSGSLTLQGVVEDDRVASFLTGSLPNLVAKLRELGYSVQNLGIKVSQEQIDESLKVRMQETPLSIRPLGIDIRV